MNDPVRFGLIGAGGIAQSYAQVFAKAATLQLAAVADKRLDVACALAEPFRCPCFSSVEAMLEGAAELDAVVVCTPPNTHEEVVLRCTDRGLHVLCEKPFALDVASARRMVEAARTAGVKITMASKFRYVEDVIRAKSIVASGILGEIILFENAFTSRVEMASRWNSDPAIAGGGVLIDNGAHSVDLTRYFLGPLAEVQAVEGKRVQNLPVEDTVRVFVRSKGGVMGSIDLSWSINKELDGYINIYGSFGTVLVGWQSSRYRQHSSRDWVVFGKGYNKVEAFHGQLTNFAAAIRGDEALLIGPADAIASVEVIEAAYKSLRQSRWTNVAPEPAAVVLNGASS